MLFPSSWAFYLFLFIETYYNPLDDCKNRRLGQYPPNDGILFISGTRPRQALLAQTQLIDQIAVALDVGLFQIIEKAPALTDHKQKATARVVIFFMLFQVLVQVVDAHGQKRDLNLRGAGVAFVAAVLGDDFLLGRFH
jgi:hypothetical protein